MLSQPNTYHRRHFNGRQSQQSPSHGQSDPRCRVAAPQQQPGVAKFGLACNRKWKSPEGETREEVMFIDCEAWGKTAEFMPSFSTRADRC